MPKFTTAAEYDEARHAAANNGTGEDMMEQSIYLVDSAGPEEPFDTLFKMKCPNSPKHDLFVTLCNEAGIQDDEPVLWYIMLEKHFGKATLMERLGLNN